MSDLNDDMNEFRIYLETSGVYQALADVLVRLFRLDERPADPISFIRENLGSYPYAEEISKLIEDLEHSTNKIKALESLLHSIKVNQPDVEEEPEENNILIQKLANLQNDGKCKSLLKKHLSIEVFNELIDMKTEIFRSTFFDCIKIGLNNHNEPIGIRATDAECYDTFAVLFDPIICEFHQNLPELFKHPKSDWKNSGLLKNPDPKNDFIESCSIFCSRSVESFPFTPKMSKPQLINVMSLIRETLDKTKSNDFKGNFYAFETMDRDTKARLIGENLFFDNNDEMEISANGYKYWPTGRAIYVTNDKQFLVHINNKHHLRFGCIQKNGDFKKLYQKMIEFKRIFDEKLSLVKHNKYGWITAYPSLLGNTFEITAKLKLNNLSKNVNLLNEKAVKNSLKITKFINLDDGSVILEMQNIFCLGITEFQTMKGFIDGLANIIKAEIELK